MVFTCRKQKFRINATYIQQLKFTGEMLNSDENHPIEGEIENSNSSGWITPAQAAKMLGVNYRYVYRLIDTKELKTDGKKHGQRVTLESVEAARLKRILDKSSDVNFTGEILNSGEVPSELSKRENNQLGALAIQGIQGERDKLLELYNQAQEQWRADLYEMQKEWREELNRVHDAHRKEAIENATTIARLQERIKQLEISQAETATVPPLPTPMLEPSSILDKETLQPESPKKKRHWWQFQ